MKPKKLTLTDLELEIMQIVWGRRQATVRDVYETLRERGKQGACEDQFRNGTQSAGTLHSSWQSLPGGAVG